MLVLALTNSIGLHVEDTLNGANNFRLLTSTLNGANNFRLLTSLKACQHWAMNVHQSIMILYALRLNVL